MARCPRCGKQFDVPLGYSSILCNECLNKPRNSTESLSVAQPDTTRAPLVIAGLGIVLPVLLGLAVRCWFLVRNMPVMDSGFFLERLGWFVLPLLLSDIPFCVLAIVLGHRLQGHPRATAYSPGFVGALVGGLLAELLLFGSLWMASGHEMMDIVFFGTLFIPLAVALSTVLGGLVGWTISACRKLIAPTNRA